MHVYHLGELELRQWQWAIEHHNPPHRGHEICPTVSSVERQDRSVEFSELRRRNSADEARLLDVSFQIH
jgi:hypothetical protein